MQYLSLVRVNLTLKNAIKYIHEKQPQAVFLTQTSATPFGWAIKEAYRIGYPNEQCPKMLSVDVRKERKAYSALDAEKLLCWNDDASKEAVKQRLAGNPDFEEKVNKAVEKLKLHSIKGGVIVFDESCFLENYLNVELSPTANYSVCVLETALDRIGCPSTVEEIGVEDFTRGSDYGICKHGPWIRNYKDSGYRRAFTFDERMNAKKTIEKMRKTGRNIGNKIRVEEFNKNKKWYEK